MREYHSLVWQRLARAECLFKNQIIFRPQRECYILYQTLILLIFYIFSAFLHVRRYTNGECNNFQSADDAVILVMGEEIEEATERRVIKLLTGLKFGR